MIAEGFGTEYFYGRIRLGQCTGHRPAGTDDQASRIIRQYSYFMVAAEPATIATKVMMAPIDKVENPVMPWPTVQPIAVTPPKPISTPPMM